MQTLSTDDLSIVTGGKDTTATSTPTSGGGNNDAMLTALNGIQSSLKDLGKNQNQGLFGGQNGLMFMTMALVLNNRRSENVVVSCNNGGCRRGFSFRW